MTRDFEPKKILQENVILVLNDVQLSAELKIPEGAASIVMFVHGSGSSRFSPRNRYVAGELNNNGFATLLFDLMSEEEEALDQHVFRRFDIRLLAQRVMDATLWLQEYDETENLGLAYFGASTGAAAALVAAAAMPKCVRSIVSRGGRPDLANSALEQVKAPTLLIVGELDTEVIALNQQAADKLRCQHHVEIVSGATHLFEEEGALEKVAQLAVAWFSKPTTTA